MYGQKAQDRSLLVEERNGDAAIYQLDDPFWMRPSTYRRSLETLAGDFVVNGIGWELDIPWSTLL